MTSPSDPPSKTSPIVGALLSLLNLVVPAAALAAFARWVQVLEPVDVERAARAVGIWRYAVRKASRRDELGYAIVTLISGERIAGLIFYVVDMGLWNVAAVEGDRTVASLYVPAGQIARIAWGDQEGVRKDGLLIAAEREATHAQAAHEEEARIRRALDDMPRKQTPGTPQGLVSPGAAEPCPFFPATMDVDAAFAKVRVPCGWGVLYRTAGNTVGAIAGFGYVERYWNMGLLGGTAGWIYAVHVGMQEPAGAEGPDAWRDFSHADLDRIDWYPSREALVTQAGPRLGLAPAAPASVNGAPAQVSAATLV